MHALTAINECLELIYTKMNGSELSRTWIGVDLRKASRAAIFVGGRSNNPLHFSVDLFMQLCLESGVWQK